MATHLLSVGLIVFGILGVVIHFLHKSEREPLILQHSPGTIASAVAITSDSDFGQLIHGHQRTEDIIQALRDKRFRIDRTTGKIVVEGEAGYETGDVPDYRRKSTWGFLGIPVSPPPPRARNNA